MIVIVAKGESKRLRDLMPESSFFVETVNKFIYSTSNVRISNLFTPFDSFFHALSKTFWDQLDRVKRTAASNETRGRSS